jgi:hypothetical protein
MRTKQSSRRVRPKPKTALRLPDLDQAKSAVLNSLSSVDAQRGYRHAIDESVEWYCSEPRLLRIAQPDTSSHGPAGHFTGHFTIECEADGGPLSDRSVSWMRNLIAGLQPSRRLASRG